MLWLRSWSYQILLKAARVLPGWPWEYRNRYIGRWSVAIPPLSKKTIKHMVRGWLDCKIRPPWPGILAPLSALSDLCTVALAFIICKGRIIILWLSTIHPGYVMPAFSLLARCPQSHGLGKGVNVPMGRKRHMSTKTPSLEGQFLVLALPALSPLYCIGWERCSLMWWLQAARFFPHLLSLLVSSFL